MVTTLSTMAMTSSDWDELRTKISEYLSSNDGSLNIEERSDDTTICTALSAVGGNNWTCKGSGCIREQLLERFHIGGRIHERKYMVQT